MLFFFAFSSFARDNRKDPADEESHAASSPSPPRLEEEAAVGSIHHILKIAFKELYGVAPSSAGDGGAGGAERVDEQSRGGPNGLTVRLALQNAPWALCFSFPWSC